MQAAKQNNTTKQFAAHENLVSKSGGRGEEIGSKPRYLLQLRNLLQTATRQNNARVIFALRSLIARRGGVA